MSRRRAAALWPAALLSAALLAALAAGAAEADDPRAHERQPPRAAQRIVTLLPSLTEIVCALGACARLVATDRFSDWPPSVRRLPKAGGLDDANIELMVGLKPDLVILGHSRRVADRLMSLGVPTFEVETRNFDDISRALAAVGRVLGVPDEASILDRDVRRSVEEIAAASRVRLHGRSPLVYYEVDAGPYAAGSASYIGDLLARLGARNIVAPELGPFPKLNPEYVVSHDPDVILVSHQVFGQIGLRPGWERIRAIRERRLCDFDPAVRDTIVRPGPRVVEGMRALADCLNRVAP